MHPLKAGGGGQARVDGDDFLEGGLKGVDLLNARQQRLLFRGGDLQADSTRQADGGFAAAGFRLLLDKQMAIVSQGEIQRRLPGVLDDSNVRQRVMLGIFTDCRQLKHPARQQSTGR